MFVWTLEYSEDAERDFELIFDHLFDAYVELGDSPDEAVERTAERIRKLRVEIDRLVDTPISGLCGLIFIPKSGFFGGTRRLFAFYG